MSFSGFYEYISNILGDKLKPNPHKLNLSNDKIKTHMSISSLGDTPVPPPTFREFKYIYSDNNRYKHADTIEANYNSAEISKHFVVAKEIKGIPSNYYNYLVFENYVDAMRHVLLSPPEDRSFHEVIFGWMPQKLKFDIDINLSENDSQSVMEAKNMSKEEISNIIDEAISTAFYIIWEKPLTSKQIITTHSHNDTKISFHKIIEGYYVTNAEQAREFTKAFMRNLDIKYHDWVDLTVNKNLQNFRMLNSVKLDSTRVKMLIDESIDPARTIITNIDNCELLPDIIGTAAQKVSSSTIEGDDLDAVLEIVNDAGLLAFHRMVSVSNNLIIFRRTHASHCGICNRVHDNENSLMISIELVNGVGKVYENCRRSAFATNGATSKLLGQFYSTSLPADAPLDIPQALRRIQKMSERIAKNLETPAPLPDRISVNNIPADLSNIYSEPTLRPFEHVDTLCVIAGMKMGKTKQLMNYITENFAETELNKPKIIFVSFRQTFSANIKDKFPDFTVYSDVKDPILRQRKLIVQVESMHRIDVSLNTPHPDLVVLDEVELILEQFDSGLLKQFNKSWATFQWLMENAKHVVCMDAALSDRTINVLKKMRIDKIDEEIEAPRNIFLHYNQYKNATGDSYEFTLDKSMFYASLYEDIKQGLKIAIPTSSLEFAEILKVNLENKYPNKSVGFYSSKTSSTTKQEHFNKVDEYWSLYDILIYTPTVSAGVSFERKHFDKVYAWFSDMSCNVEVCMQMLGRVRNVALREYVIGFDINGGYAPTTVAEIKASIYYSRESLFGDFNDSMLSFTYTKNGQIRYYNTDYFTLWLENTKIRNLSRVGFVKRLSSYLHIYGAVMKLLEFEVSEETVKTIKTENKSIRDSIHNLKAADIAKARELTEQQVVDMQDKFMKQEDIDPEDQAAYEKYKLRRDYNYSGVIDAEFVLTYEGRRLRRIYKNLVKICENPDPKVVLEQMQDDERNRYVAIMEGPDRTLERLDVTKKYIWENHRIAMSIILTSGWKSVKDPSYICEHNLAVIYEANETLFARMLTTSCSLFNVHPPGAKVFKRITYDNEHNYVTEVVGYFNRILESWYGIKIKYKRGDSLYSLCCNKNIDMNTPPTDAALVSASKIPNIYHKYRAGIDNADANLEGILADNTPTYIPSSLLNN